MADPGVKTMGAAGLTSAIHTLTRARLGVTGGRLS